MNQNLYLQEKNEEFEDYVDRIFDSWNKEKKKTKKNCNFRTPMFFIQLIINGIANVEVRNRMLIWSKKQNSIYVADVIRIAKEFHKYQQKIPGLMEFLTIRGITDYEETKRTIIYFINEHPEEIEPFLNWFWNPRTPGFVEYLTRVGITDDEEIRIKIINFIINKYPEEVELYFNEHLEDPICLEESDCDTPNYNHYNQQKDEAYIEYLTRIERTWSNEKKIVIDTNQKFFFQLFINGIRDADVKRKTNKWYKIYKWFKIEDCICIFNILEKAEEFQKEKDNMKGNSPYNILEKNKEFKKEKDNVGMDSSYNILEKAEELQKEKDNMGMDSPIFIDLTGDTDESEDE